MTYYTIFAGSPVRDPDYIKALMRPDSQLICADSGANIAFQLGAQPDVIIGDFDSIKPEILSHYQGNPDIIITPMDDQSTTDLQKALNLIPQDAKEIAIFGALGGRMDHVFANILLLEQYPVPMRFALHDEHHSIRILTEDFQFDGQIGDKIGILPIRPIDHLRYEGLQYPADTIDGPYTLGWLGTSNVMSAPSAKISITGGAAIFIHYKEIKS